MTTKSGNRFSALALAFLFALPISANAGLLRLESNTYSSARNGEDLNPEAPIYEYFEASYDSNNRDLSMNANFSYFDDIRKNGSAFNLYGLDLSYKLARNLKLKIGRSFNFVNTIGTSLSDSGSLEYSLFSGRLRLAAFGGAERTKELETFKSRANTFGAWATYTSSSDNPLVVTTKFQTRKYTLDSTKPTENLAQLSAQKPIAVRWTPTLLGTTQFNTASWRLRNGEGGVDLYPSEALSLHVRGQSYYVTPTEGLETPLFAIFSVGRLYEGSAAAEYRISAPLSVSVSYGYDDYAIGPSTRTNGHKAGFGFKYRTGVWTATDTGYVFSSFGGKAYGNILKLAQRLSDRFGFAEEGELTRYEKITGSKRWAYHTGAGLDYWIVKTLKFEVGGEFNSNNILQYDVRGIAKLTYLLWAEI